MDPMASFSSFKDEKVSKNVWLSGSGRTINSAKSGSSSRSLTASSVADYALTTSQTDEIFHVLHHDAQLATQRLAVDKIAFERVLAESATRQLWLCQFEGEEIVVKRLNPPDNDDVFPAVMNFVHEIRLTAAKKVAMSDHFEAKLIDLTPAAEGSPPVDQKDMAAGIGNAFWTAPELLTGGSPTPATDIYAFGVLLAEIDSEAKRPYYSARDSRSGEKLRAFQVLYLVASGELRPHFAANCPTEVREVALACMRQNPMQRPTAHEVLQGLQSCSAGSAA
ncbi:hypothetical protein PInf_009354 [Phytophthora infestans]|nr:hypothetical protein PInf_009354 [Phytophthora infestans]